jgi:UDP-glucose 4-epimerase
VALRIFNAYGPGQALPPAYPPVVPQFLNRILRGGSVVVFGTGGQTRDYVYVSDVVDALVAAADREDINGEVINIGSGVETSVEQLIARIEELTGRNAHVLYNQEQSGGVRRLVADLEKAERLLDYRPQVSLQEGLERTLQADERFRTLMPQAVG